MVIDPITRRELEPTITYNPSSANYPFKSRLFGSLITSYFSEKTLFELSSIREYSAVYQKNIGEIRALVIAKTIIGTQNGLISSTAIAIETPQAVYCTTVLPDQCDKSFLQDEFNKDIYKQFKLFGSGFERVHVSCIPPLLT